MWTGSTKNQSKPTVDRMDRQHRRPGSSIPGTYGHRKQQQTGRGDAEVEMLEEESRNPQCDTDGKNRKPIP